ncbi:hypothetical protein UA08_08859 [Talaromyces atroroseus]|uniref:Transcription factor domain-containing protein n=1 Tax=Talaromyces atroroseus TaxID=1441469 RepID=A0A225AAX8_TALAT|nr:hypothetical protein UA08_08859 [Talaromyces atroroseus]OKL55873.1 hypothetical protein UA08_08859 [Talaromyces atroroseus]
MYSLVSQPRLLPIVSGNLSEDQTFLFHHFFYTLSRLIVSASDDSINVYRNVIIPMAFSCPDVLDSLLLLAATHLSSRYDKFTRHNAVYKGRVLRALIRRLETDKDLSDISTLTTIIMLSINEVFEANSPSDWVKHLVAAGKIVTPYLSHCRSSDKDMRMILDIFTYHNVLALISTGQPSLFTDIYYQDSRWASLTGQRTAFLASVDALLSIAAQISCLIADRTNLVANQPHTASQLRHKLELWSPPDAIPDDFRNTGEAMRHAALLMLQKSNQSLGIDFVSCSRAVISHLRLVPIESSTVASHLWPLFMAGSCLTDGGASACQRDRYFVRERLVLMEARRGFRTVEVVKARLERMWCSSDMEIPFVEEGPMILY